MMAETQKMKFSREFAVEVPATAPVLYFEHSDWKRLKKMISKIVPPKEWFKVGASLCAGAAIASATNLIQVDTPSFRFSLVAWVTIIAGGILALALYFLDGQQRNDIRQSTQSILDEMSELEKKGAPSAYESEAASTASTSATVAEVAAQVVEPQQSA